MGKSDFINKLKKLREETSAPIAEIKKALEEAQGNEEKAKEILRNSGFKRAAKKAERETKSGVVESYLHSTGASGAVVVLATETDFVARHEDFKNLAREIAMQVTAMRPETEEDLLSQTYIREPNKTIGDLIQEHIAKFGENIKLKEFKRFEV